MRYIYAAMILHELKENVTADKVKAILTAAGTEFTDEKVNQLIKSLDGVDITDAVKDAQVVAPQPIVEVAVEEPKEEEAVIPSGIGLDLLFG